MQPVTAQSNQLDLWYLHHSFIVDDAAVAKSKALIDKAAAAGYNGAVFWDTNFDYLGDEFWPPKFNGYLKNVLDYAKNKYHMKTVTMSGNVGWSNDVVTVNPNWAEASRVIGSQFTVDASGRKLQLNNSFPGLVNNSFEAGKANWDIGDRDIGITKNGRGGSSAATIVDASGNARFRQRITLKPWRQYHLTFWYKSSGFHGGPMIEVLTPKEKVIFNANINAAGDHPWGDVHYSFNSQDTTAADVYLGVWGGSRGMLTIDDITLEETAFVFVEHREGAPFKLYDPANPSTVYREGKDYDQVLDPEMHAPSRPAFHNVFHWPTVATLPAGTSLKPGQIVAADYYAVFPMTHLNQVSVCLTEPGVYKWLDQNARELKRILPADGGVLLSYDEMRQINSCYSCRARNLTAGQLLAWSIGKTTQIFQSVMPKAPLFIWSDMLDPYHNAHNDYYYAEGDLAGSWKGLPPQVSIMNWNMDHLKESLTWFSGRDSKQPVAHRQMIAGFYDRGAAGPEAQREWKQALGIPGINGIMYTTYADDYSQMQSFAEASKAGWREYLASLPKQ